MKTELESKVQRRCQSIIKAAEGFVIKTHGDMYARTGIPDLIACIPSDVETIQRLLNEGWFKDNKIGLFVSLEIKRKNKLSEVSMAQEIVGNEIKNAGGIWFAIDDSELAEAIVEKIRGNI